AAPAAPPRRPGPAGPPAGRGRRRARPPRPGGRAERCSRTAAPASALPRRTGDPDLDLDLGRVEEAAQLALDLVERPFLPLLELGGERRHHGGVDPRLV